MLKHIDRLMILGYFKSYAVCLTSLLSLYIVVDLFTNLDDFIHHNSTGLKPVVLRIVSYYGYRIPQFFDRLCEAIVLLAAMFTVAMMQRNNEQIPLLSAGVSTHRIVLPVLFCASFMMTLTVLNQELMIPRIGHELMQERSDPQRRQGGRRPQRLRAQRHPHRRRQGHPQDQGVILGFRVMIPETINGTMYHITAKQARYIPARSL